MVEEYLSDREQEEALRLWWRDNWRWILGGIVLGVALLFGWFKWKDYREDRGIAAAKQYEAVQLAAEQRNVETVQKEVDKMLAEHGSTPYARQGQLLLAKLQADAGKYDEAANALRAVADKSQDDELGYIAKLRLARILIQQGKHDEAIALLDVEKLGSFAGPAREVRGDAYVAKGDQNAARAEYAAALTSGDAQIDRPTIELKLQEVGGSAPPKSDPLESDPKSDPPESDEDAKVDAP